MIHAARNVRIDLSRNDGSADNSLMAILGMAAKEQFQIQGATLFESSTERYASLQMKYKGRTKNEADAMLRLFAKLGQNEFSLH